MGADGYVSIYDADAIDAAGLSYLFFDTFTCASSDRILLPAHLRQDGKTQSFRVFTVYWDTEGIDCCRDDSPATFKSFEQFCLAESVNVWT